MKSKKKQKKMVILLQVLVTVGQSIGRKSQPHLQYTNPGIKFVRDDDDNNNNWTKNVVARDGDNKLVFMQTWFFFVY